MFDGWAGGASARPNAAWAQGLAPPELYEWFSNCYQMRCDVHGDCHLHGPYEQEADGYEIAIDFLAFCLLAARNQAVPADWSWRSFLQAAPQYITCAFEKSDASEHWGSENAQTAGRSLRHTAIQVYGSGPSPAWSGCQTTLEQAAGWAGGESPLEQALLEDVGGAVWAGLLSALRARRG